MEIKRLERLLGAGDRSKSSRLKSKIEAEVGFGSGFMSFLDEVADVVGQRDDEGYERKHRQFEEDTLSNANR